MISEYEMGIKGIGSSIDKVRLKRLIKNESICNRICDVVEEVCVASEIYSMEGSVGLSDEYAYSGPNVFKELKIDINKIAFNFDFWDFIEADDEYEYNINRNREREDIKYCYIIIMLGFKHIMEGAGTFIVTRILLDYLPADRRNEVESRIEKRIQKYHTDYQNEVLAREKNYKAVQLSKIKLNMFEYVSNTMYRMSDREIKTYQKYLSLEILESLLALLRDEVRIKLENSMSPKLKNLLKVDRGSKIFGIEDSRKNTYWVSTDDYETGIRISRAAEVLMLLQKLGYIKCYFKVANNSKEILQEERAFCELGDLINTIDNEIWNKKADLFN